jgi:Ca2+-dependent lipid-binding protein
LSGNPSATDDVEVDVDFKWLSEMDMELTVVLSNGMELSFGMSNFRISGTLRMHFYDLIVKIPPFANCKVTFFKKPDIDFSINVMKTDIMDFGITHASIGDAVQFAMKQALQSMAIYPEWQLIELEEPSDDLVYMKSGKFDSYFFIPS